MPPRKHENFLEGGNDAQRDELHGTSWKRAGSREDSLYGNRFVGAYTHETKMVSAG
jgi:hypothetical protein